MMMMMLMTMIIILHTRAAAHYESYRDKELRALSKL